MENQKSVSQGNSILPPRDYKSSELSLDTLSHDAGKKIGDMASGFAHSANEYVTSGRDYVSENPYKGVAIAAATGAVVGSLITMAMRSKR